MNFFVGGGGALKPWRNKAEKFVEKIAGKIRREIRRQFSPTFAGPHLKIGGAESMLTRFHMAMFVAKFGGELSGPFCLETPDVRVRFSHIVPNCSSKRSFEHCDSKSFFPSLKNFTPNLVCRTSRSIITQLSGVDRDSDSKGN